MRDFWRIKRRKEEKNIIIDLSRYHAVTKKNHNLTGYERKRRIHLVSTALAIIYTNK